MKVFTKSNYRNSSYIFALFLTDLAAYFCALFFAYATRLLVQNIFGVVQLQFSIWHFIFQLWWILALFIVLIVSFGLYSRRLPFWKESRELTRAATAAFILAFALVSLGKMSEDISRLMIILLWLYSTVFLILFRYFIKSNLYNNKFFAEKAVIIGSYKEACSVARSFRHEYYLGFDIAGIVTVTDEKNNEEEFRILGHLDHIRDIIASENITVAVFLHEAAKAGNVSFLVGRLQIMLSKIIIVPDMNGLAFSNAETFQTLMTQLSYFQINNNLKSFVNRFIKRSIDILLCVLALPFMLVVTFVISVIIKSTSTGPIFYAHRRVGRNGKRIWILKFRSMYKDADARLREILKNDPEARKEWETSFKLKNDPRITPIGRFLRRTSLDELPQVFNVLIGDMSFIGPRPVIKDELDKFYKDFASYYLMVRPGITGLWQISGRSNTGYDFRVARDTWYVLNWSVWLDLIILLKTPVVVFKGQGAY